VVCQLFRVSSTIGSGFAVWLVVRTLPRSEDGFSLSELLIISALLAVVSAIAIPSMASLQDRLRLNQSARNLERDLHSARNKAVANNRPMRVLFNCPAAGQYRVVELLGSVSAPAAADAGPGRCQETNYPYPPPDNDYSTRPNFDGPVRRLDPRVSFGAVQTIEFWTDGSAHAGAAAPLPMLSVAGTALTLTKPAGSTTRTATITVNGIGKIKLQPVQ